MAKQSKKTIKSICRGNCAACCLAAMAGCAPHPAPIHGQVTLDAKPLSEAVILFVPLESGRKKTGGEIVDGVYHIAAEDGLLPGKYRVEVADNPPLSHDRPTHATSNSRGRRIIPPKYAHDSPLTAELTVEGAGEFNFELESMGKH